MDFYVCNKHLNFNPTNQPYILRHKFIYKNFRYISVHIWNNITDKLDTRRAKLGQIQGGLQRAIQDSTKGGLQ